MDAGLINIVFVNNQNNNACIFLQYISKKVSGQVYFGWYPQILCGWKYQTGSL
jgi:hypothetical protein